MVAWLSRLDSEADNLRAALEWSFEADPEAAMRLSVATAAYWRSRSMGSEAIELMAKVAELASKLPPPAPSAARERTILVARVFATAANASLLGAQYAAGARWAEEAVALARQAGDDEALLEALAALATNMAFSGRLNEAGELADEMVGLAESRGDWLTLAAIEANRAYLEATGGGDLAAAGARLRSASEAADRSRNPRAIAGMAASRGELSGFTGRLAEAREWLAKAIAGYEEIGDRRLVLMTRSELAHTLRRGGEIDEAEARYRDTRHGWQHAGNRGAIAHQLECFGFLATARKDFLRAARLLAAAEAIREVAEAIMVGTERAEFDAAVGELQGALDATAFDSAWAEGGRLTTDEAVALAISG
jgi:hypothetical protein